MGAVVLIVIILAVIFGPRVIRTIRKNVYFGSDVFLAHKSEIAAVVAEHNEVAAYTAEIRNNGTFAIGGSSTGSHAHLASFENTSSHRYRRDRNIANYAARNVHNCSLQVVRSASADPIKYVMKYFSISVDETSLRNVERLGESIARLENAVENLRLRETSITQSVNPPRFILKHYLNEFMQQVGVAFAPIVVPYPVYVFEYVSAGGNSSQRSAVTFNTPTIDVLIETLSQKIHYRRSSAGQRALMTAKLRNFIKARDNYTCKFCSVSLAVEPHLLLEVDHVVPVSKGGLSTPDNLQTLCWRCNRSKSDKYTGQQAPARVVSVAPGASHPISIEALPPAVGGPISAPPPAGPPLVAPPPVGPPLITRVSTTEDPPVSPVVPNSGSVGRAAVERENLAEQFEKLASLHASGVLSDDEFQAAKARILG